MEDAPGTARVAGITEVDLASGLATSVATPHMSGSHDPAEPDGRWCGGYELPEAYTGLSKW